jgi:hypothetical protein
MQVNLRPTLVINSISSISAWSLNKCITYDPHRESCAIQDARVQELQRERARTVSP